MYFLYFDGKCIQYPKVQVLIFVFSKSTLSFSDESISSIGYITEDNTMGNYRIRKLWGIKNIFFFFNLVGTFRIGFGKESSVYIIFFNLSAHLTFLLSYSQLWYPHPQLSQLVPGVGRNCIRNLRGPSTCRCFHGDSCNL